MGYRVFGSFASPSCEEDCDPCSARPTQSHTISYSGANLPCTGIHTCDTLSVALQKIDEQMCILINALYNLTTTTTTTII